MRDKAWANRTVGATTKAGWKNRRKKLDGYHTPKKATLEAIKHLGLSNQLWECANGFGRISRVLKDRGYRVYTSDVFRWHSSTLKQRDFLKFTKMPKGFRRADIITNPPFKHAQAFVEHAMQILPEGGKVAVLLRLQFMEGQKRKAMFDRYPPQVYIFSYRLPRMHQFGYVKTGGSKAGSTLAFAWFVFTKGSTKPSRNWWL